MPRQLNNWIESYLEYTAETEAARQFHFWTGIATLAATLERKVWIDLGTFQWVPNFFILLVGRPGIVRKSTSIRIGERLLRRANKTHFGPTSLTWQSFIDALKSVSHEFPIRMHGEKLSIRQAPISLFISEFGNFFDPRSRELVDLLTDLWDGSASVFRRRTRKDGETQIVNAWVHIIGCTTPAWIADNFTTALIGGGFASRTIFVWGETTGDTLIAYPGISDGGLRTELEAPLVADLQHIHGLRGPMTLTPGAIAWGTQWYAAHAKTTAANAGHRLESFNARRQTHLHKIAMVLAVAESDSMEITEQHLIAADRLLDAVRSDVEIVYDLVSANSGLLRAQTEILRELQNAPNISKGELFKRIHRQIPGRDFDNILTDLIRAGRIKQTVAGANTTLQLVGRANG